MKLPFATDEMRFPMMKSNEEEKWIFNEQIKGIDEDVSG